MNPLLSAAQEGIQMVEEQRTAALTPEQADTIACMDSWARTQGLATYSEVRGALQAALPFIDDAGDIAQFYPDSSATKRCRDAVAACRAALSKAGA